MTRRRDNETAYAKINLALHVRERMADNYHRIETVFAFCDDGDRLDVAESDRLDLRITGRFAAELANDADNLVIRAAEALRRRFGVRTGARLTLDKRLPIAAGLGGGSADAAATLRLLSRWWRLDADDATLLDIAAALGADVPACVLSRTVRGEGKGDALTLFDAGDLSGKPVLLVNPRAKLSTAAVFAAWDGEDRGPLEDWRDGRNDLLPAAAELVPAVTEVLAALKDAEFARLSGSGATGFGLYADEAKRDGAAAAIAAAHPGWWLMASRLL